MTTPFVVCAGSPFDRGRAHGSVLRELITVGVARWRDTLVQFADGDVDVYLQRFVDETDFLTSVRRWTPDLLEEVEGLAEGAGLDRTTALAYQFMDEQWCYEHRKVVLPSDAHRCSSVAIARQGGGRIVAQNMDLPTHFDGTQVVLHNQPDDGPSQLLFTAAGLVVTTGLNSAGVGVCVNSILDRPTAAEGLPVAFVIRGVLALESAGAAAAFVRDVSHASGQNYVIADSDDAFDLEAYAGGVDTYIEGEKILHTNHSLAMDEEAATLESYAERHRMDLSGLQSSHARREALVARLGDVDEATEDDVIDALSDLTAPICRLRRPDSAWMTFGSIVSTATDEPEMRLAPGPPTEHPYTRYTF